MWNEFCFVLILKFRLQNFAKTKLVNLKCVASKELQRDDVIVFMQGNVISKDEGYVMYKSIEENYTGTLLFNLGRQFDFKW